jgi:hypothetical protein
LIYRFNRLFNVSKVRAAVVSVLCVIGGVVWLMAFPLLGTITASWFVFALIYGCIWFYKYNRDDKLRRQSPVIEQPTHEVEQSMTTPGSNQLFVPKPLDRQ